MKSPKLQFIFDWQHIYYPETGTTGEATPGDAAPRGAAGGIISEKMK
ncbi:MAG: hypothetical protein QM731_14860 [Chitinophagaceae bacterium]